MSTAEIALPARQARPSSFGPLGTLARRRFQLTARTPRELVVPLLTPTGCAGVLALELRHGGERLESIRAAVTILAAQLSALVGATAMAEAVSA